MPNQPATLLTVEQAADRLAVGRTTVYALLRTGELDSVKVGRLRRIPLDALRAYLARLTGQASGPGPVPAPRQPTTHTVTCSDTTTAAAVREA
jgi:excisionase family DNA binding protein